MPYVLGGVGFANNTIFYDEGGGPEGNTTRNHTGYVVGAGIEAMLASNISAFAEYRYADYGSQDYGAETESGAGNVHLTDSSIRAGLNFHFN